MVPAPFNVVVVASEERVGGGGEDRCRASAFNYDAAARLLFIIIQ